MKNCNKLVGNCCDRSLYVTGIKTIEMGNCKLLILITCILVYVTGIQAKPTLDIVEGIVRELFSDNYRQNAFYDERGPKPYNQHLEQSYKYKPNDRSYKDICRTLQYDGFMNKMGVPRCPY